MLINLLKDEISFDDYISMNNIKIFYKRLPKYKRGLIFRYKDINSIFINCYLSDSSKRDTLLHEFAHLELCHLDKVKQYIAFSIYEAEDEADRYLLALKSKIETLK